MEKFQQKFIDEANELINKLEEVLLDLELSGNQEEKIDEIFRIMHSLKGASGMFGFHHVGEYTHFLENIYDKIRDKKLQNSQEIIDVTLQSVDYLRSLLKHNDKLSEQDQTYHQNLIEQLQLISNTDSNPESFETNNKTAQNTDFELQTFYILFRPKPDIFANGTNPLFIVDELVGLGDAKVIANINNTPSINLYDHLKAYAHWEVFLVTDVTLEEIKDVFLFVEEEAIIEVHKLANGNLLKEQSFQKFIKKSYTGQQTVDFLDLNTFVLQLSADQKTKDKITKIPNKQKTGEKEAAISSIRVDTHKIDELMNLVSELVTMQASLNLYSEKYNMTGLSQIVENLENLTRQLRDNAFSISLVPIEVMVTRFKRLVRDLAREFNKKINFVASGTETELDKSLIQELSDPLMHIIRNSIDHGIEPPEERIKKGKPEEGLIKLSAYYSGTNVIVAVKDDGKGIDMNKVREKAINKKFISPDTEISDKELLEIVFMPGFSTATTVTDISGRGVGMDVVKRKIDEIHGQVELNSTPNVGTEIIIKLPLTLSIIDGMLLKVGNTTFVLPLSEVKQIYPVKHSVFGQSYNSWVVLDGEQVPYFYLRNEFQEMSEAPQIERVITIQHEDKTVGIVADDVIGNHQSVLKPIGKFFNQQQVISAATILGDGSVALVLDPHKIVSEFSKAEII